MAGAGTKTRAGKAAVATAAAAGTAAAGRTTRAGKEVVASSIPALTPKVEVTEEEPASGPLLPYPRGLGPKVEDSSASHSTPPAPPPPAPPVGEGPSNASQVIRSLQYCGRIMPMIRASEKYFMTKTKR